MNKAQKRFYGAALSLSTVASVIAPVAVSAATVTFEDAKAKVDAAKATPVFSLYNKAYEAVMALSNKDEQAQLLNELSPLWAKVATPYVTGTLAKLESLAKDKNLKDYNEILAEIEANTDAAEAVNKEYLLGQLADWGSSGSLYGDAEKAAIDAINAAWGDQTPAKVAAAKEAISKVTNAKSVEWLNVQIAEVQAKMSLTIADFKATGESTLQVTFNKAVADTTKMVLTLKRDGSTATVSKTDWNDDKTVATLTLGAKIQEADYQLFAKYDAEAEVSSKVLSLDESKPAKIEVLSSRLAIKEVDDTPAGGTTKKRDDAATFRIRISNQYGEDITDNVDEGDLKIRASKGDDTVEIGDNGLVTITGDTADGDDEFSVGESVSVTVTYKPDSIIATKTLTVVESAEVASITIGDLTPYDKNDKDHITSSVNFADDYYLPLTVKDQDGNVLTKEELEDALDNASSSNDDVFDVAEDAVDFLKEVDSKPAIKLIDGDESGKVVITVTAKNGVSATKEITVDAGAGIDKLTFNRPDMTVKRGDDFVLTFNAFDQYGKQLVAEDDFETYELQDYNSSLGGYTKLVFMDDEGDEGTEIEVDNGTIDTQIDYSNNNALQLVITADPDADDDDQLTVSVNTVTGKTSEVNFNIKDEAYAEQVDVNSITTKVLSDAKDQSGAYLTVPSLELKRSNLALKDQYGDSFLAEGYKAKLINSHQAELAKYITYTAVDGSTVETYDPTASVIKYELEDDGAVFNLTIDNGKIYDYNLDTTYINGRDPKIKITPKAAGVTGTEDLKVSVYKVKEATVTAQGGTTVKVGALQSSSTDEATVSFEAVAWKDITGYTIDAFSKVYTGTMFDFVEDATDAQLTTSAEAYNDTQTAANKIRTNVDEQDEYQVDKEAFGLLGTTKVKIPTGLIADVRSSILGVDAFISSNKVVVGRTTASSISSSVEDSLDTDDADKTGKVIAVFNGYNGKVYNVENPFTYSSKDPVVTTFELRDEYDQVQAKSNYIFDEAEIDGMNIDTLHKVALEDSTNHNKPSTGDGQKAGIRFYTKDQYGVEVNGAQFKISSKKEVARAAGEASLSVGIDSDGKLHIDNAKHGDAFTITALTNDAQYKAITITLDEVDTES